MSAPSPTLADDLPALRGVAYLNAGTNGPVPRAAADAMAAELRAMAREPRLGKTVFERLIGLREAARAAAARALGAEPADVALTASTTAGVGIVVAGLPWRAGDEVVTTTEEHPGLLGPLDELAARHGVVVRAVTGRDVADAVGPRTRMVAVSHVLWTTGEVLPVADLVSAAHAVGATVLLDGAQGAGAVDVDAAAAGVDFYAASGQKWLLGPMGSGALFVHPRHLDALRPVLPGYLCYVEGRVGSLRPDAGRFDPGTIDPVNTAGFLAALEWVESQPGGRAGWNAAARARMDAALATLRAAPGVEVAKVPRRGGLVAVRVAGEPDTDALVARLGERGVLVRTIPGTPYVRLSIGAWTTDADVEAFVDAVAAG